MPESDKSNKVVIKSEENQGRYLVAGADLEDGDVILSEYPVVAGPLYTRSKPVCLACLMIVGENSYRCNKCNFPLCDEKCEEGVLHQEECKIFKNVNFSPQIEDWNSFCPIYSCITVLRTLILRDTDPEGWKIVDALMDHDKERTERDSPTWKIHELLVVSFILKTLGLQQFTHLEIRRVIGILRTNSVKLESRVGFGEGIAIYPTYSFANHSCLCNSHTKKYKDLRLELIAQASIKQGEIVWTRYTTPQLGNFQRIADIQRTWHFQCSCARCQDPTEFGTMLSGLMCREGCPGILLPKHSNILGSPWSCSVCKKRIGILTVEKVIKEVTEDIGKNREESNQDLIKLIQKYEGTVLHPNHYLLLGIKEIILQRLMMELNNKEKYNTLSREDKISSVSLRSKLFREIVCILEIVDSPGAPWRQKLEKMEKEEKELLSQL